MRNLDRPLFTGEWFSGEKEKDLANQEWLMMAEASHHLETLASLTSAAEEELSSGINWKYEISNADPTEPPIRYSIGVAWASGECGELIIGLVHGLDAVRTAYARLPGLSYHRELWLQDGLSGPAEVADAAVKYQLDLFARGLGKEPPLIHGGFNINERTLKSWISDNAFVHGKEIAEFAGLLPESRFMDIWREFAIASKEYPKKRWGTCPEVTALKVRHWHMGGQEEVVGDERIRVLDAAEAWARAYDPRSVRVKADEELASLLSKEEVSKPIVNKWKDLRHPSVIAKFI